MRQGGSDVALAEEFGKRPRRIRLRNRVEMESESGANLGIEPISEVSFAKTAESLNEQGEVAQVGLSPTLTSTSTRKPKCEPDLPG